GKRGRPFETSPHVRVDWGARVCRLSTAWRRLAEVSPALVRRGSARRATRLCARETPRAPIPGDSHVRAVGAPGGVLARTNETPAWGWWPRPPAWATTPTDETHPARGRRARDPLGTGAPRPAAGATHTPKNTTWAPGQRPGAHVAEKPQPGIRPSLDSK